MEQEPIKQEMPKKLAIDGKVISIEKIGEKSQAQFAAQLKQNGIVITEERLTDLYNTLHDMAARAAEEAAQANAEEVQEVEEAKEETTEVEPTNTEE